MVAGALRRVPLPVRMFVYGASFLGLVLAGLPWLAYRVDVYMPALHFEAGPAVRILGAVVFGIFVISYLMASYLLTSRGRGAFVEFDPPAEFVSEGMYRWVRNPVAACLVAALLGEALMFSSTGILLLFLTAMLIAHVQVTRLEEPLLRKRFGAAYEEYCRRVPRWLPRRPREESSIVSPGGTTSSATGRNAG